MKIAIYNKKGGTGKSTISGILYLQIKEFLEKNHPNKTIKIYTNDDSILQDIYTKDVVYQDVLNVRNMKEDICILDLGGFVDSNTLELLKNSSFILIPFAPNINSLRRTITLKKELDSIGIDNYNLIFTQFVKKKQVEEVVEIFGKNSIEYFLPLSNMLDLQIKNNLTFNDIKENPVFFNWYKSHIPVFEKFINDIIQVIE